MYILQRKVQFKERIDYYALYVSTLDIIQAIALMVQNRKVAKLESFYSIFHVI